MNRSAFLVFAAAAALWGCRQSTNQQGTTTAPAPASDAGGTPVALVGCLLPGAGSQSGAVGTSGNSGAGFVLIDVTTTGTAETSGTPGTGGTPGTSGRVDTGTPRTYSLIGEKQQDDLQKYQNSKVEVTGVLVASTDTGAGVPDVGAASAPAGTPPTNVERVRVNHVRQLDKSCSGTNQKR
jgi:hypothetical protein